MIRSFKTSNPALKDNVFRKESTSLKEQSVMTLDGTVNKTGILLTLLLLSALYTFNQGLTSAISASSFILSGFLIGLVLALIISFKAHLAPVLSPIYAIAEGVALGAVSANFESRFPGIASSAIFLTIGTLFSLLFLYKSRIIKVTNNFRMGVLAATGGIFFLYILSFIGSFFGFSLPFIHSGGTFGILFSLAVVVIASLNLVLDFDFIERGCEMGMPKYMEWYGAFGLLVTLIWLYLEILRLLEKLQSRD